LYMTAISLSTVGFGEIIDVGAVPGARLYTIMLIVFGMGVVVYFGSTVVAFVVEGELNDYFRSKKMNKRIEALSGHVIICGAGSTGIHVVREMIATRTPFVVIDNDEERLHHLVAGEPSGNIPYLVGDASSEAVLQQAGISRARGLIVALPDDKENLFVVITARGLNPGLRIVARGIEETSAAKLARVGADSVVLPNRIGGMRMASEMIRPHVVEFLDVMLRDKERNLRVEEVTIGPGAPCAGKPMGSFDMTGVADVLVVAAKHGDGAYRYNPGRDFLLQPGVVLIVLGTVTEVDKLRRVVSC